VESKGNGWAVSDEPSLFIRLSGTKGYVLCAKMSIDKGFMFAHVNIADLRHVPDAVSLTQEDAIPFSDDLLIAAYGDYALFQASSD
jgi:hypothetical protein